MSSNKVFAPVIFFIAAREALEASLVMGTLEGMLEQLVGHSSTKNGDDSQVLDAGEEQRRRATIRRMRKIVSFKPPTDHHRQGDLLTLSLPCFSLSTRS